MNFLAKRAERQRTAPQRSRRAAKDLAVARRGSTRLGAGLLFRMGFLVVTLFLATFFFAAFFLTDFFAAVRLGEARLRAVFFLAAILFLGAVFRLFFLTAIGRPSLVSRIAQSMWTGTRIGPRVTCPGEEIDRSWQLTRIAAAPSFPPIS